MEVICLEETAFYTLVEQVVERIIDKQGSQNDKWVSHETAMQLLNVKSKTTLQKLRDEGKVRFSQPQKRVILYDRDSINHYLEQNAKDTF